MAHLHNGILLGPKKNKILPFVKAWIDLEGVMLSEINQSKKEKYHDLNFMWNLKDTTSEQTKQKQTHRHRTE